MKNPQKTIEKTLKFIAQKGYQNKSNNFLKAVSEFLVNLFDVDYVLIDKYSLQTPSKVDSVVVFSKKGLMPNISYKLANTPCENVIDKNICAYPNNIQTLFPKDEMLVQMNIESYIGIPLWSSIGEPIGLIAILNSKPINDTIILETILQIVAIKAAQVLEKEIFDNVLELQIKDLKSSNKQLLENKEKFSKVFYNHPTAMEIVNISTGERIDANESYFQCFEYDKNEFFKGNIFTETLLLNHEHIEINNQKLLKEGVFNNSDFQIKSKTGKINSFIASGTRLNIGDGNLAILTFLDVTNQKKSEESLKRNEEKFKKLANLSFEGILISHNGIALDVNKSFLKMFGYKSKELLGENVNTIIFPEKYHKIITENRISNNTKVLEIEAIRKDGSMFDLEIESRNINIGNGIKHRVTSFRDLTERKKIESENIKFSTILKQSANTIVVTDILGNIEYTNPKFTEVTGYTAKEALGLNPRVLSSGKQSKEFYQYMWETIKSGKTWKGQFQNKAKNGTLFWEQSTITPIKNEAGEIINYLAIKEDITKRKKSEDQLKSAFETIKEKEDYLSTILKTTNEGFWTINNKGITLEVNPEMCKILGYSQKNIIGKSIFEFVDKENTEIFIKQLKIRNKNLSSTYEIELLKSNAKNIPCLFKTSPIYNNKNEKIGSFAMVTDISELKKAYEISENQNQELRKLSYELSNKNTLLIESTDRFKNLFEQSPVSIWEQDFSEAIALLLTKKAETSNLETYLDQNPNFVKKCISKIKVLDVNKATLELLGVKNKEELLAQIVKTDSEKSVNAVKKELLSFIYGETEFKDETEFIGTNGEVISAIIKSTLINTEGKVIASIIDVSELTKAKEKAEGSDRLKTEFLNNMSHEIRTPMNGILGFSNMLNEPDLEVEKRKYFVNIIQNSGNQLLHVIDDILEISRLGTKQVTVIDEEVCLNDLLLELFSIFDIKAKENKTPLYLKKELSDKQSTIITDKSKLNKILSNLLENALKFTNEGFIEFGYNLKSEDKSVELEIYVKDTGIGINPKKHKLIFERFEQAEKELTKKVGGLGLGLSIAKENSELLGGKISVKSKLMEGATFYITMPFKPVYVDLKSEVSQNKYTILIAEDEEVNYMYIETILTDILKLDCKIIHAKNGLEVIDFCKNNEEIDIILMDLKMPVLNGYEATKEIRKFNSNIPIIAQTAYTSEGDREKAILAGCNEFISKPINKELFSDIINNFLIIN